MPDTSVGIGIPQKTASGGRRYRYAPMYNLCFSPWQAFPGCRTSSLSYLEAEGFAAMVRKTTGPRNDTER
mgnify:CR=1 FL=1